MGITLIHMMWLWGWVTWNIHKAQVKSWYTLSSGKYDRLLPVFQEPSQNNGCLKSNSWERIQSAQFSWGFCHVWSQDYPYQGLKALRDLALADLTRPLQAHVGPLIKSNWYKKQRKKIALWHLLYDLAVVSVFYIHEILLFYYNLFFFLNHLTGFLFLATKEPRIEHFLQVNGSNPKYPHAHC